mmetsp:Transcript_7004/g.8879  ORF Transcript_7004/g.8879 Transcript_7004/m.8879 type:complete len:287 (+) Transcript_7004:42-902(+)
MSRLYQRLGIFAIFLVVSLGLYLIKQSEPNGTLSENGAHLFNTVTHLSLHDNNVNVGIDHGSAKGSSEKNKKLQDKHKEELELEPCTIMNPLSHHFIDLSSLSSKGNEGRAMPWSSKGYDTGLNFTIGVCSSPFKKTHDTNDEVKDITNSSAVGAYYIDSKTGKYVSIGEYSTKPVVRGKKITLSYTSGSYCENMFNKETGEKVRKSTILTFTCDRDMLAKATVSYVGSFNDCSYIFEVRSHHACPTAAKADNLAVIWIFFFILLAALLVYFSGGLVYKQIKLQKL